MRFLLGLLGVALALPAGALAQAVRYPVRGHEVRLEVDAQHILVRPQNDVTAPQAAEAALRAQSKSLGLDPAPALKQLAAAPALAIPQLRGVLVPRLEGLDSGAVAKLAEQAPDELRSSALVYRHGDRLVVPRGTLSVRFRREMPRSLPEDLELQELDHPEYADHVVRLQPIKPGVDPFRVAAQLRDRDDVLWAEPDLVCNLQLLGPQRLPNDPHFKKQWYLHSIHAPEAWALSVGSKPITVAVLDDGVDQKHPDLRDKMVKGYDFVEGDDDPQPDEKSAHGTCCAGIIGAATDNGEGVAGIAWKARIMPLRICSAAGFVDDDHIAKALLFARDNGARILSCSWGGGPLTNKVVDALDTVTAAGCLIVAASGNALPARGVFFPASYEKCLAVGALRHDDTRWDYSCFGPSKQVSLMAPSSDVNLRGDIWTTDQGGPGGYNPGSSEGGDRGGNYCKRFGGTSAACPVVAGVAALVWSSHPGLKAEQVRRALLEGADRIDEENAGYDHGWSKEYGAGKVNALAALVRAAELERGSAGRERPPAGADDDAFTKGGINALTVPAAEGVPERRLHAALKPVKESWQVRDRTVTVQPSQEWVAVIVPVDPAGSKAALDCVLAPQDRAVETKEVRKQKDQRILLVPRSALRGERTLQAAAKTGPPPLRAVYRLDKELLVPLDTFTCRLKDVGDLDKLRAFARRRKLEIVERSEEVVKLRWAGPSAFTTVFEALRAVQEEVPLRWAEPDLVRQIHKLEKD